MIICLLIAYLIRYQLIRRKNSPFQLYNEALQNENKGNYKEALLNYELALLQADKNRFYSNLKNRIHEKRKLLNTIIEYENNIYITYKKENILNNHLGLIEKK